MRTALVGGTLLDGTGALPRSQVTIVLGDGRIAEVADTQDLGSGVQLVDVSGRTVMPGIIDAHVHLAAWASG
jgi:imidazolonepropionase-like amidohydrolase